MSQASSSDSRPEPDPALIANSGLRATTRMDVSDIILRRWGGAWIDFVAMALILFAPIVLLGWWKSVAGVVIGCAAVLAYFPLTEGIWGRSLGKLVTGTIVVDADGNPPGAWRAIVRTLLRFIEVNPFLVGGVPAGVSVLVTKHRQRLGDLAAGTYVVPISELAHARRAPSTALVFS